jgi:hypothetical protein
MELQGFALCYLKIEPIYLGDFHNTPKAIPIH